MAKTFNFIIINKSNMTSLYHCSTSERAADYMTNMNSGFNFNNWIAIYKEKVVVDFSEMVGVGGDVINQYRRLKGILEKYEKP